MIVLCCVEHFLLEIILKHSKTKTGYSATSYSFMILEWTKWESRCEIDTVKPNMNIDKKLFSLQFLWVVSDEKLIIISLVQPAIQRRPHIRVCTLVLVEVEVWFF